MKGGDDEHLSSADLRIEFAQHGKVLIMRDGNTMGGMMGGMMSGSLAQGAAFSILTARVERVEKNPSPLAQQLTTISPLNLADAVNANAPRAFSFAMQGMNLTINGRAFERCEIVRLNTLEVWELSNDAGGGGMIAIPYLIAVP